MKARTGFGLLGCLLAATTAYAIVTFDGATGFGFVGKGDLQTLYVWNNKALQDNAVAVSFRYNATVSEEVSWECTNENNERVQPRSRKKKSETHGLLSSVARVKNQVTGWNLNGWNGPSPESTPIPLDENEAGPPLNSCPSGPWSLTTPAGEWVVTSSTGGLQVNNGSGWIDLPITPPALPLP
jgi:hypothetical protein